jgi:hypothetical protein
MEQGKRKTAGTIGSCCFSFQSLRLVLTTYVNADGMVGGMAGVAHVESTSAKGKATNLKGHLDSVYDAKDCSFVGNQLLRMRGAAILDIARARSRRTRGSVRLGFRRKRHKRVWQTLINESQEGKRKTACLSQFSIFEDGPGSTYMRW